MTGVGATRRITVVNPNTSDALTATITAAARAVAPVGTTLVGVHPDAGVPSVESHAEEAVAAVGVLQVVRDHDADTDAFVVACFGDTGVAAARELATGPVVGMTEAALQTACLVAHRFAVITLPPRTIAHTDRVVAALGLAHRCTVAAVDVAVLDLEDGAAAELAAFTREGRRLVADGAEAIVLGCAGLAELVEPLGRALGVPVIDGVAAAVGLAAGLLAQGLTTSTAGTYARIAHPGPVLTTTTTATAGEH
ncbi:allantoin racemase [Friedmanniella endophytica]|uniref:Allantoin racemase n=1 Tax=Microlunatus kandeliicorticis TaxID=1759536 RepID=A0A7W3P4N2_9ACTN|nr:aspartate/glutamate racemase family protein [Microlunatus kandeliicorticis]MBA8792990.1 allantoin racemase [Microlunatus kandeliicorticis]